eukprot:scaffold1058_cov155-Ochromonas_danica.AAC.43
MAAGGDKVAVIGSDFQPLVHIIAQLLGWRTEDLSAGLTSRTMTLRGETARIAFNVQQAQEAVNALAKEIYGRIFNFIVYQANLSLQGEEFRSIALADISSGERMGSKLSIGVLDIFGFEKFKFNSFEQLCINYANEKLQQYFITFVLKKEQELYAREGIESSVIIPLDNTDVLQLLEGKGNGIFARLDDETKLPKGSDEGFLKKVESVHNNRSIAQRRFVREVKMLPTHFEIRHFAGQILYDCTGFLEKNRDKLFDHLETLLASSSNNRFRELIVTDWLRMDEEVAFESLSSAKTNVSSSNTIASRFQSQLQSLMNILENSQPHFIKCIKPNSSKLPMEFEEDLVLQQLRYSGVLEAIQIRKSGYPTRRTFEKFWKAFWMVPPHTDRHLLLTLSDVDKCELIISRLEGYSDRLKDIKLGKTMVFLRSNTAQLLEAEKERRKINASLFGQSHYRRKIAAKLFLIKLRARDSLRAAEASGRMNKSSNVDAIRELTQALSIAREEELPTAWIVSADTLLKRLLEIKDCLDKMVTFEKENYCVQKDIVEEFCALQNLMNTAEALDIDPSKLSKVNARLAILKERADCVIALRESIQEGDEFLVSDYVRKAQELTEAQGKFCEQDLLKAKRMLNMVEDDHQEALNLTNNISACQSSFKGYFDVSGLEKNHVLAYFKELDLSIAQSLQLWKRRAPISKAAKLYYQTVDLIPRLHRNWASSQWEEVTTIVKDMMASMKALSDLVLSPVFQEQERLFETKARPSQYSDGLVRVVNLEVSFVQHDIRVNFILPKLLVALETGKVSGSPGFVPFESLDCESLTGILVEFSGYEWLGQSMQPLLSALDSFLELKTVFLDRRWERIITVAESSNQRERRIERATQWLDALKRSPRISEDDIAALEASIVASASSFSANLAVVDGAFKPVIDAMCDQVCCMLQEAVDQYLQLRLIQVLNAETPLDNIFMQNAGLAQSKGFIEETLSFVKTVAAFYLTSCSLSEASLALITFVENMLSLWELFDQQKWSVIVDRWNDIQVNTADAKLLTLRNLLDRDQFGAHNDAVQACLNHLRTHSATVILVAIIQTTVSFVTSEIISHPFSFGLVCNSESGSQSEEVLLSCTKLRKECDTVHTTCFHLKDEYSVDLELIQPLEDLIKLARAVTGAREVFCRGVLLIEDDKRKADALESLRSTLHNLSNSSYVYDVMDALRGEIQEMELSTKLSKAVENIRQTLKPDRNTDLHYLIPAPPGAVASTSRVRVKRPTSVGAAALGMPPISSPVQTRKSTLSFDGSPVGTTVNNTADPFEDILIEEGVVFNPALLSVNSLNECLEQTQELLADLEDNDEQVVPPIFSLYATALEHIRDIRSSIYNEDWPRALKVLNMIQESGLQNQVKEIQEEISTNEDTIRNLAVIMACHNALSKGQPSGPIGQVDYKLLSLNLLEEAIELCQSVGCTSERAKALFDAVLIITDLRKAQKLGDWAEIKSVLSRADNQHIGEGMSSVCCAEISKSCIERDNYDITQALKAAIINEEMFTKEGTLDVDQVSTNELSAVIARVHTMPEDTRSSLLKHLYMLADSVLKARKCAVQNQWQYVESLLPVLKESMETFQNELENKDKQSSRKTMSFRTSSFRTSSLVPMGSMLGTSPKDKQKSILPVDGIAPGSSRSAAWEEFAELTQSVKREIRAIEHHFAVTELEKNLNDALIDNGIVADEHGAIDKRSIQTEELQEVLEHAASLDLSNLSLPKHLKLLRKVGMLIFDIRRAFLKDQWELMSSLLEETLGGEIANWPECSRLEIQAVRKEVANKWIVTNLTSALQMGRLDGEAGRVNLSSVSTSHLPSYIDTAKSLNPSTELAQCLVHTAEAIQGLRELLMVGSTDPDSLFNPTTSLDWTAVKKRAKEMLAGIQHETYSNLVIAEVKLILETAEDQIVCSMLSKALSSGGPAGEPGALQVSAVVTKDLERAYNVAVRSSIKTAFARSLLQVCRTIQKLREAIVRTEWSTNDRREQVVEAWRTVRALLHEILDQRDAMSELSAIDQTQSSWRICRLEIELMHKHSIVEDLKNRIVESAIRASHIYDERNTCVPSVELDRYDASSQHLMACALEMETIVQHAQQLDFDCAYLSRYKACATTLHLLRKSLAEANFDELRELLAAKQLRNQTAVLSEAKQEIGWILCDYHNSLAIRIVRQALEHPLEDAKHNVDFFDEKNSAAWFGESFVQRNNRLKEALEQIRHLQVTSKVAQQWVDCCANMYSLRTGLTTRNRAVVNQALRWFRNAAKMCPLYVKMEAQRAFVIYQNDVISQEFTLALQNGKARGKVGEIDLSLIDESSLGSLIAKAEAVQPLFVETAELLAAARVAFNIRASIKYKDFDKLKHMIEELAAQDHHNLLIVDEIAVARSELDNAIAVSALTNALKSFEDNESRAFDISFLQDGGSANAESRETDQSSSALAAPGSPLASPLAAGSRVGNGQSTGSLKKNVTHSILDSLSDRRYSFANKNSANIDPETIDVEVLEKGLRVARDHGIYSQQAIRLCSTVELIKSLRLSMKQADWASLQEILDGAKYEEEVGKRYDFLASKEILAVRSQLEIRAAIVDLAKALRKGWAKCSQGIVDISNMDNEHLANAIDCADRCIMELSIQIAGGSLEEFSSSNGQLEESTSLSEQRKKLLESSPVHKRVQLLMESARTVLQIREVLAMGNMELAGSLADEALSRPLHHSVVEELRLYAKEISIALSAINIAETLRRHLNAGKLKPLFQALSDAFKLDSHQSCDLGLIRVLDNTERVYRQLESMRQRLLDSSQSDYNPELLDKLSKEAKKLNYSDEELQLSTQKLEKLIALQKLFTAFNSIWICVRNERSLMQKVVEEATILQLTKHPQCQRIKFLARLQPDTLRVIKLYQAIGRQPPQTYAICTETIRWKRTYLDLPSSISKYRLENFPKLRRVEDFAQRMTLLSEELMRTMLLHSDQPLPTSLTQLSPPFAALAVTVFTSCIRGIEHNIYTYVAVAVKKVIELGCTCVHLRDEILLQIIKQLRFNTNKNGNLRMWKLLCASLYHFPPSRLFESFLESFLMQSIREDDFAQAGQHAQRAQRFLHRTIFLHGQGTLIKVSSRELSWYDSWIVEDMFFPIEAQAVPGPSQESALKLYQRRYLSDLSVRQIDDGELEGEAVRGSQYYEEVFGVMDLSDPAFAISSSDDIVPSIPAEPTKKASFTSATTAAPSPSSQQQQARLSMISVSNRIRGSREDWIARFRAFQGREGLPTGNASSVSRYQFALQIAQAVAGKSELDRIDKQALCCLIFNKRVADLRPLAREFLADREVFHFASEDEARSSAQRRDWLWKHLSSFLSTPSHASSSDAATDLFFSQLQLSELTALAERFWEVVVERMARECRQFPFLRLEAITADGDNHVVEIPSVRTSTMKMTRRKSGTAGKEVSINWEIFREIVLTGMHLALTKH